MILCHYCETVIAHAGDCWHAFHDHCLDEHRSVLASDPGALICTNLLASPDALLDDPVAP